MCGEVIVCVGLDGCEVVCGFMNYSSVEMKLIYCKLSGEIEIVFGYMLEFELIYCDNFVLV